MKRLLVFVAVVAAVVVWGQNTAFAHTPSVSANCDGLSVSLTDYEGGPGNSRVFVTVNGESQVFDFGGSFVRSFPWARNVTHAWTVHVDANRNVGDPAAWDVRFDGLEPGCEPPETSPPNTNPPCPGYDEFTGCPPIQTTTTTTVAATTTTTAPSSSTTTTVAVDPTTPSTPAPTVTTPAERLDPTTSSPVAAALPPTGARTAAVLIVVTVALLVLGAGAMFVARRRP